VRQVGYLLGKNYRLFMQYSPISLSNRCTVLCDIRTELW